MPDKLALILGGTPGMALATAERLLEEGAFVYGTGRQQQPLADAARCLGPKLKGLRGDAASLDDLDGVFATIKAEVGRLDILFASADSGKLNEPLREVTPVRSSI
jgi:NAD(P)-dependent dehydrogenase (short-subunit alcohol dehydrogenase family)